METMDDQLKRSKFIRKSRTDRNKAKVLYWLTCIVDTGVILLCFHGFKRLVLLEYWGGLLFALFLFAGLIIAVDVFIFISTENSEWVLEEQKKCLTYAYLKFVSLLVLILL